MQQNGLPGLDIEPIDIIDTQHTEEKQLFELMLGDYAWAGTYQALLAEGWAWRKAAYIAWAAVPADRRVPKNIVTGVDGQPGFANIIGLRDGSSISKWRLQNPAIDLSVRKLQMSLLSEATPAIMDALIKSASTDSYKNAPDRKLALEIAGVYTPKSIMGLHDASAGEQASTERLSDEDLARASGLAALTDGGGDE